MWSLFGWGSGKYTLAGYSLDRKITIENLHAKDRKIVTPMGSRISQLKSLLVDIQWNPTDAALGTEAESKFRYRKKPPLTPAMFSVHSVQVNTSNRAWPTNTKVNASSVRGEGLFIPPGFFRASDLVSLVNDELNDPTRGIYLMKFMDGQLAKNEAVVNLLD